MTLQTAEDPGTRADHESPLDAATREHLACCETLAALDETERSRALDAARLVRVESNREWPLDDDELLFLVSGRALLDDGVHPRVVLGDAPRARAPIAGENDSLQRLLVAEDSTVVRIPRGSLQGEAAFTVTESDLDAEGGDLVAQLFEAHRADALVLPSMPETAMKLRRLLDDPEVDISMVASTAQSDAVLAGSLVRAANSALFAGSGRIANVRDAVARLGTRATQQLAMAVGLASVFQARHEDIRRLMRREWLQSITVAAISFVIARKHRRLGLDPERALLAGLIHRIGAVPLLCMLDEHASTPDEATLIRLIDQVAGPAGALVVSDWQLGDDLETVVGSAGDWSRQLPAQPGYLDVIQLAVLVRAATSTVHGELPEPAGSVAAQVFGLDDEAAFEAFIDEHAEDFREAQRLLIP